MHFALGGCRRRRRRRCCCCCDDGGGGALNAAHSAFDVTLHLCDEDEIYLIA